MEDESELSGIMTLRLFPLGGVVFFPHTVLPLHIFEARYRRMTEDALATNRLITIVMVRPGAGVDDEGRPEIEEFACVGRIFKHERLADGRFNMLLVGLKRVRLLREIPTDKPYRIAESRIIEDIEEPSEATRSERLLDDFRLYLEPAGGVDPDLEKIITPDLPLGVLVDILSHTLNIEPAAKQKLLADCVASSRADQLHEWFLRQITAQQHESPSPRDFPPPFSPN